MNGFQMEEFEGRILLKQEMEGNGDDAAPQCCARPWGALSSAGCHGREKQQSVLADPKAQGRHELLLLINIFTSVF